MKHSSFLLTFALVLPALVACKGELAAPGNAEGTDANDSSVESGGANTCSAIGGTCVGLAPGSCANGGHFADATKASCGPGVGVGCCVPCDALSPPGPDYCSGGAITPVKDAYAACTVTFKCAPLPPPENPTCPLPTPPAPGFCSGGTIEPIVDTSNGCTLGYDCTMPTCPVIAPPGPGFCPGGTSTPVLDGAGCVTRFDCVPGPTTGTCVDGGGTCVGLAPGSCPSGNWASATTHSCGPGIGVGCCLP